MFALRPLLLLAVIVCPPACAVAQRTASAWTPEVRAESDASPGPRPTRDDFAGTRQPSPTTWDGQAWNAQAWDGHAGPLGRTLDGPTPVVRSSFVVDRPPVDRHAGPARYARFEDRDPLPEPVYGPPPPAIETFPPRRPPTSPLELHDDWDGHAPSGHGFPDDCRTWNCDCDTCCDGNAWTWQLFPQGLLYRSYLAGPKESRLGGSWIHDGHEWFFDGTLGGHFGLIRYGTLGGRNAEGYQLGFEGAAQLRINWTQDIDMDSTDYRFGIPLTMAEGPWEWRFGYYHLSSHTGDEFLVRNATFERENYVRDSVNLGIAYFVTDALRVYGEASWAFHILAGAERWHFQFGFDYSPVVCGPCGSPFLAANTILREEVDFGGGVNVQAGWQWQQPHSEHLFRLGLRYYNGKSTQYSFFDEHMEFIGAGLWYDY